MRGISGKYGAFVIHGHTRETHDTREQRARQRKRCFFRTSERSKSLPCFRGSREDTGRGGKRFSSTSSSTDEGCCSAEGELEEGPSGDELREAQIKLEEHRLGLDHDISQRIDSQIVNRRLSDYQHHFDNPLMDPIDPPSRTTLFMAGGSGNSSSELFESSFDSGCPPDYAGTNCFTSSLPSCTPPPPKSPSPITGRISRVSQGRRASDGGPRLLFYQQGVGDARPSKQRSIQGAYSNVAPFCPFGIAAPDSLSMITR